MLKGPFWVVNAEEGPDDHQLLSCSVSLDTHPVPSHKEVWKQVRGRRTAHWNYYPRGRIEVRRNKAIVFANLQCFSFVQLEEALRTAFDLGDHEIEFKADNSGHYCAGVFGKQVPHQRKDTGK